MLRPPPIKFRKRPQGQAKPGRSTPTPPAALDLTAADVNEDVSLVTMQFDRAINIAAIDVTQIQVGDIGSSSLYQGSGSATHVDARTVAVPLVVIGPFSELELVLTATAETRIVAVDDGGTWAGTSGTGLPFP